jgi:hypothetical protein
VATTVKVDESPPLIDVGAATMVTAVADGSDTVTVAFAEALPPEPLAVAV